MNDEAKAAAWATHADRMREQTAVLVQQAIGVAKGVSGIKAQVEQMLDNIGIEHRWVGSSLQIMAPDGEYGPLVDLLGPIPAHQWAGTSLAFQKPDGEFAAAVDLKGTTGATTNWAIGTVTTGEPGSDVEIEIVGTAPDLTLNFAIPEGAAGQGDVDGPNGAVEGNFPVLDATGKVLSDSGKSPSSYADAAHEHPAEEITDSTAAGRALLTAASVSAQRTALGLGTAATANTGTGANQVVVLDGDSKLPAVDASNLVNLPVSGGWAQIAQTVVSVAVANVTFSGISTNFRELLLAVTAASGDSGGAHTMGLAISRDGTTYSTAAAITASLAASAVVRGALLFQATDNDGGMVIASTENWAGIALTDPFVTTRGATLSVFPTNHQGGMTALRILMSAGNIDAGTFTLYGR